MALLSDNELDRHFLNFGIPRAGRDLVRQIRETSPVRDVQNSMNSVRVRHMSGKMGRALLAESRTVEFPGIYAREFDDDTFELWPQPCKFDLWGETPSGKRTRVQHTPDLFLIGEYGFLIEEWREEARLVRLAQEAPHRYYKDATGRWHDRYVEREVESMNLRYQLRSADEHPRIWLQNMRVLEDFTLESTIPVPYDERERLLKLLKEHRRINHLELVYDHKFSADHILQLVLLKEVYVNLDETLIHDREELVIYSDETTGRADAILKQQPSFASPSCAVDITPGMEFTFDGHIHHVVIVGKTEVKARGPDKQLVTLSIRDMNEFVREGLVAPAHAQMTTPEFDEAAILKSKRLAGAINKLKALHNPKAAGTSARTIRWWKAKIRDLKTSEQVLTELMSKNPGNTNQRIPDKQLELLKQVAEDFYNGIEAPNVAAAYSIYVEMADDAGTKPMARSTFYERIKKHHSTEAREGKKKAYQEKELRLHADYKDPVHGVLPHQVVYIDHTPLPIFMKGRRFKNLGKPTLTLATDGAVACPRAFFLGFKTARTLSVLMCLRDYVRRHGCLPRIVVVDNGKEFHSHEIEAFASIFNIQIRWRRASQPRDSSRVERALGVVQQEITDNLKGNSKSLRDPRGASATHNPENHTEWTLKALHGSLNHYFFTTLMERVHPVHGVPPREYEEELYRELGERKHRSIAFDKVFKLLSSPRPKYRKPRMVDDRRGVWVDGAWHWHPSFALAKRRESAEVRIEPWNAQVAYVCFRGEWLLARARDNNVLHGRFEEELEYQRRLDRKENLAAAQRDKATPRHSRERTKSWEPQLWDERLREQCVEEYYVYKALGMVEAVPEAENHNGLALDLGLPKQSVNAAPVGQGGKNKKAADEAQGSVGIVQTVSAHEGSYDEDEFEEEAF